MNRINLSNNQLKKCTSLDSLNKLKYLNLNYNQLSEFHTVTLVALTTLTLSRNLLQMIPDFSELKNLIYLDLSFNKLSRGAGFSNLSKIKNLKVLDVGFNDIDLNPSTFRNMIMVHLKKISKLHYLSLKGNPVEFKFEFDRVALEG